MRVANWDGQELGRVSRWVREKEGGREGKRKRENKEEGKKREKGRRKGEEGRRKIGIEISAINIVQYLFL